MVTVNVRDTLGSAFQMRLHTNWPIAHVIANMPLIHVKTARTTIGDDGTVTIHGSENTKTSSLYFGGEELGLDQRLLELGVEEDACILTTRKIDTFALMRSSSQWSAPLREPPWEATFGNDIYQVEAPYGWGEPSERAPTRDEVFNRIAYGIPYGNGVACEMPGGETPESPSQVWQGYYVGGGDDVCRFNLNVNDACCARIDNA